MPPLTSFVVAGYVLDMGSVVPVVALVLVVVAIAGAVVGAATGTTDP